MTDLTIEMLHPFGDVSRINEMSIVHAATTSSEVVAACQSLSFISPYEQYCFEKVSSKKQREWLLGRYVAKQALLEFLSKKGLDVHTLDQIEIRIEPSGVPYGIYVVTGERIEACLSISHTKKWATASTIATSYANGIGVDIEQIRSFETPTLRSFMSKDAYEIYGSVPEREQPRYATMQWCLKEAYLKALGVGLRVHPKNVEVMFEYTDPRSIQISYFGNKKEIQAYWTIIEEVYILVTIIL